MKIFIVFFLSLTFSFISNAQNIPSESFLKWVEEDRLKFEDKFQRHRKLMFSLNSKIDTYRWVLGVIQRKLLNQIDHTPEGVAKTFYSSFIEKFPNVSPTEKKMFNLLILNNVIDNVAHDISWQDCGIYARFEIYKDDRYKFPYRCSFLNTDRYPYKNFDLITLDQDRNPDFEHQYDYILGALNGEFWEPSMKFDRYSYIDFNDSSFLLLNRDRVLMKNKIDDHFIAMKMDIDHILNIPPKISIQKKLGIPNEKRNFDQFILNIWIMADGAD